MLWSTPAWRWGLALFAATTVVAANLALALGFNITGFVALAAMISLANLACTSGSHASAEPTTAPEIISAGARIVGNPL
jgi:hypothetical protein